MSVSGWTYKNAHGETGMKYFRIHTADTAYVTGQPRGIFTAVGKLADAKLLSEEEEKEYWQNREYFEKVLPVPPFYETGNPDRAITWFKDNDEGRRIEREMTFYRRMACKYGLKLFRSECEELPGEVIYEDAFQIAVIPESIKAQRVTVKPAEEQEDVQRGAGRAGSY